MKIIKYFIYPLALFFAVAVSSAAFAQDTKQGNMEIEDLLKNREFIFKAQSALPMRGSMIHLTSPYDIVVSGDSLTTHLPYFGRAYSGVGYNNQGGIRFTSTDFEYDVSDKRKKRWNIMIRPDNSDVQQLILNVSESGFASLQVISTNKDPITFNGYVTSKS